MDDVRKYIYGALIFFVTGVMIWLGIVFVNACGLNFSCPQGSALVDRTPIPTLIPATLPVFAGLSAADMPTLVAATPSPTSAVQATQSNISPPVAATLTATSAAVVPTVAQSETQVSGTSDEVARPSNPGGPGQAINLTGDANSGQQIFVANCQTCHAAEGKGGNPNLGSDDGTIPELNPIDPTLKNPDYKIFATNLDLFLEHGSTPAGINPTYSMPPWGDSGALTPQQIADAIAYVISLNK